MALTDRQVSEAYKMYGHLVVRRCRIILRDEALAEDALHEVFVRVIKYGHKLAEVDDPVRWLYRVAERVCFDMLRRRKNRPEEKPACEERTRSDTSDPQETCSDREALIKFLDRFGDRTKRLILLYYVDGLSQKLVAEELGWSRQTVNKKLAEVQVRAGALRKSLGIAS
jgi:RNA polymerase sigma-70 factor (ECF subfamily)